MKSYLLLAGGALCALGASASGLQTAAPGDDVVATPAVTPSASADERGWLGVYLRGDADGAVVGEVVDGSPAERAGLRSGDRILRVGDHDVAGAPSFVDAIGGHAAGDTVHLTVARGDAEVSLDAELGARPQPSAGETLLPARRIPTPPPPPAPPAIAGADVRVSIGGAAPIRDGERELVFSIGAPVESGVDAAEAPALLVAPPADEGWLGVFIENADDGVLVGDVVDDSPAEAAGLRSGDVIQRIAGQRVTNVQELIDAISSREPGAVVAVRYLRDGGAQRAEIELAARPESMVEALDVDALQRLEDLGYLDADLVEGLQSLGYLGEPEPVEAPEPIEEPVLRDTEIVDVFREDLMAGVPADDGAFLGVYLDSDEYGVLISELVDGAPASAAGLRAGDRLVRIDARRIETEDDVYAALSEHAAGDRIAVRIDRDGDRETIRLHLGSRAEFDPGANVFFAEPVEPLELDVLREPAPPGLGAIEFDGIELEGLEDFLVLELGGGAYLGVGIEDGGAGARVTDVYDGTAAAIAGLREGDEIVQFGDARIGGADDLIAAVSGSEVGELAHIELIRDGAEMTLHATLGQRELPADPFGGDVFFDAEVVPQEAEGFLFRGDGFVAPETDERAWMGVVLEDDGEGVWITDIVEGSPADEANFRDGDALVSIDGRDVGSYDDVVAILGELSPGERVRVQVVRGDRVRNLRIELGAAPRDEFSDAFGELELVEPEFEWDEDAWDELEFEWEPIEGERDFEVHPDVHGAHGMEDLLHRIERMEEHLHDHLMEIEERLDRIESRLGGGGGAFGFGDAFGGGPSIDLHGGDFLAGVDVEELLHAHGIAAGGPGVFELRLHDDERGGPSVERHVEVHVDSQHGDSHQGGPMGEAHGRAHVIRIGPDGQHTEEVFEFDPHEHGDVHEWLEQFHGEHGHHDGEHHGEHDVRVGRVLPGGGVLSHGLMIGSGDGDVRTFTIGGDGELHEHDGEHRRVDVRVDGDDGAFHGQGHVLYLGADGERVERSFEFDPDEVGALNEWIGALDGEHGDVRAFSIGTGSPVEIEHLDDLGVRIRRAEREGRDDARVQLRRSGTPAQPLILRSTGGGGAGAGGGDAMRELESEIEALRRRLRELESELRELHRR